jgi:hypothetical protein
LVIGIYPLKRRATREVVSTDKDSRTGPIIGLPHLGSLVGNVGKAGRRITSEEIGRVLAEVVHELEVASVHSHVVPA